MEVLFFNKNKNKFEVKIEKNEIFILRNFTKELKLGEKIKFSVKDNTNNISSNIFEFVIFSKNERFFIFNNDIIIYVFIFTSILFIAILIICIPKKLKKRNKKIIKSEKQNSKVLTNSILEWNKKLMILRQKKEKENIKKDIFSVYNNELTNEKNTIIFENNEKINNQNNKNFHRKDFSKIADTTLNENAFNNINDLSDIEKKSGNLSSLSKSSFIDDFKFN